MRPCAEQPERIWNMEKVYKTMGNVGGANIALGIIMLVTGITAGILTIVSGARLLANRKNIIF